MVTTEIGQISRECSTWRSTLRSQKEELLQLDQQLQTAAAHLTNRDTLQEVEHFQNQFHIQQINIHDLKHAIRDHEKISAWEMSHQDGQVSDATISAHEDLFEQFQQLQDTLASLKTDFHTFSASMA
jgi:uncharacterized protein YydD (DUF2326 family)